MSRLVSDEQLNIAKNLETSNVLVDSVAGSGKTTSTLHIAEKFTDKTILLLTYNSNLKIETREKVIENNITNLEVHSYHSFAVKYYDRKSHDDTYMKKLVTNKQKPIKQFNYDIVILDESQDIVELYYVFILKILQDSSSTNTKLCILGDLNQTIYSFKDANKRYLTYADKIFNVNSYGWAKCKLSTSFRITNQVADFLNRCLLNYSRVSANKVGNKPDYLICNTFSGAPFRHIRRFFNKYKPEEIFILAPSIKNKDSPVRLLENSIKTYYPNISIYVPCSDEEKINKEIIEGKLVISTFHQTKGLERKLVIVYSFDDSYFKYYNKHASPLVCPNEIYVAVTRTLDHLIVIHHNANSYMPFISKKNLATYTNLIIDKKISVKKKQNNDDDNGKPMTVTKLCGHLSFEILSTCMTFFEIVNIRPPKQKIDIPVMLTQYINSSDDKQISENISDINGTAIPLYFEYKLTGKIGLIDILKEISCTKTITNISDHITNKTLTIAHVLYIANKWISYKTGYLYKMDQIKTYNWITDSDLEQVMVNINTLNISKKCIFEQNIIVENNEELCGYVLGGDIDCIDSDVVYEFKCVNKIDYIHYLQLALYAYLCEASGMKNKKYKIYNILTDELNEIVIRYDKLQEMVKYLITNKEKDKDNIDDETFVNYLIKIKDSYSISTENNVKQKNIMVIDIETDGHSLVIQIAYNLYDQNMTLIKQKNIVIKNDKNETDYYNRISIKEIIKNGVSPTDALNILENDLVTCKYIVGHNIVSFDIKQLNQYSSRYCVKLTFPKNVIDTMKLLKNEMNLKNKIGRLKAPKLEEMYEYLCNETVNDTQQHSADYDVFVLAECFKKIIDRKLIILD